jgi:hypothetical protein
LLFCDSVSLVCFIIVTFNYACVIVGLTSFVYSNK